MNSILPGGSLFHDRLRAASTKLLWIGVVLTILGIAAVGFPMFTTLVGTLFVGWLLLISGIVALVGSFSIHGAGPFFGALLFSLLSVGTGLFLLVNPLVGEVGITLALGMLFMLQGASELFFSFEMRPLGGWVWMLISGVLSIAVAIVIIATWPGISLVALGILIGVNFISSGIGYIFVSQAIKP